jgi:hypothetical protein
LFDTRDDYRISKTIVDKLFALNDPSLPVYASKKDATPKLMWVTKRIAWLAMPVTLGLPKHLNRGPTFWHPTHPQ